MIRSKRLHAAQHALLLALCALVHIGCANLRLPAIDPYGRRIFLPRPAFTTLNTPRRGGILPQPAFVAPPPPEECSPANGTSELWPSCEREWPLIDRLFGPVEDEPCYQTVDCVPSGYTALCVPLTTVDCLPVCPPYGPYQAILCDPCATTSPQIQPAVVLPSQQTTVAPLATAPAIASSAVPVTALPRDVAYTGAPGTRGVYAARLQLNPARLVAPVGREVILRAGLCGDDGYLIRKQPIEWSLSQDSVGSFVEVDEFAKPLWRRLFRRPPTKTSGAYAIGRTSTAAQVLTRGTADTSDDVWLAEGQTWISVTSASEGVSHVSAVAPTAAGWAERRQTATIHWVDGQWTFPPPSFASAGTSRRITTHVTRASSGAPIAGWIVRYEILDTTAAGSDRRVLEVPTDTLGNATVEVTPLTGQPGVTQIQVQVIRIGRPGDLERLVVGEGTTSITWTTTAEVPPTTGITPPTTLPGTTYPSPTFPTPSLSTPRLPVSVSGPQTAEVGGLATYQVDFVNRSQSTISNAQIAMPIPRGMDYVSSEPAGNLFGDEIRWPLGDIQPQGGGILRADFRVISAGQMDICARARVDGVDAGDDCVFTQASDTQTPPLAVQNRLGVRISGPETARVGERVAFTVTVTNLSNQPLPQVLLRDEFDAGLGHVEGGSPIEWAISQLGANQSRDLPLRFTVLGPGQHCHTVTVTSGDGSRATARACIRGDDAGGPLTPAPGAAPSSSDPFSSGAPSSGIPIADSVVVDVQAPAAKRVGEIAVIEIRVRNTGSSALTGIQLTDEFSPALFPEQATDGYDRNQVANNRLVWDIPIINPGAEIAFQVQARCRSANPSACHSVNVRTASGINKSDVACVRIDANTSFNNTSLNTSFRPEHGGPLDANRPVHNWPPHTSRRPASGGLRVTVSDLGDPARVNERLTYIVMIHNDRDVSDRDVVLTITLPEGARFETSINPPMIRARNATPDGRTVEFLPLAELRASESATYRIVATSARTGTGTFRAEVTSARAGVPSVVTEDTTFFAQ